MKPKMFMNRREFCVCAGIEEKELDRLKKKGVLVPYDKTDGEFYQPKDLKIVKESQKPKNKKSQQRSDS
jgi:hypothetical protein